MSKDAKMYGVRIRRDETDPNKRFEYFEVSEEEAALIKRAEYEEEEMIKIRDIACPSHMQLKLAFESVFDLEDSGLCYGGGFGTDEKLCKYCRGDYELNAHACDFDPPVPVFVLGKKDLEKAKSEVDRDGGRSMLLRRLPVLVKLEQNGKTHTFNYSYARIFNNCAKNAGKDEWEGYILFMLYNLPYFSDMCYEKICSINPALKELVEGGWGITELGEAMIEGFEAGLAAYEGVKDE